MSPKLTCTAALVAAAFAAPAWAQVSVSAGLEYLTGDYGKARSTEEWRIPLALGYRTGAWNFRLSLPLSRVDGIASAIETEARGSDDGNFIGDDPDEDNDGVLNEDDADDDNDGVDDIADADDDNDGVLDADDADDDADGVPDELEDDDDDGPSVTPARAAAAGPRPGRNQRDRRQSGVGDASISAFYTVLDSSKSALGVDLGARVKVPVASSKQCYLTNGEIDYSVQANLYQTFGRFEPYASLGWTKRGDPGRRNSDCVKLPGDEIDLRNPLYATLGLGYRLSDASTLRLEYDFRQRLRSTSDPRSEARVLFQQRISDAWRLGAYALAGFSDNSPDWGAGATLNYRF